MSRGGKQEGWNRRPRGADGMNWRNQRRQESFGGRSVENCFSRLPRQNAKPKVNPLPVQHYGAQPRPALFPVGYVYVPSQPSYQQLLDIVQKQNVEIEHLRAEQQNLPQGQQEQKENNQPADIVELLRAENKSLLEDNAELQAALEAKGSESDSRGSQGSISELSENKSLKEQVASLKMELQKTRDLVQAMSSANAGWVEYSKVIENEKNALRREVLRLGGDAAFGISAPDTSLNSVQYSQQGSSQPSPHRQGRAQ